MTRKFKGVLSLVLTMMMAVSLATASLAETAGMSGEDAKAKCADADVPKLVFLYTGYCGWYNPPYTDENAIYKPYTKAQLDKLGNANGFVLCHAQASFQNYDTKYIPYMIDTLKTILSSKPDAKVWLSTPATNFYISELGHQVQDIPSQEQYRAYLDDIKSAIINDSQLGKGVWRNNVAGMYYIDEDAFPIARDNPAEQTFLCDAVDGVPRYFTGHWQEYESPLGFVREMGKTTNRYGLKFLWSPLLDMAAYGTRIQQLFDADVFDYIIIQPSYYFWYNDITGLQRLHDYITGQSIDNITSNKTQLGLQMEVDENATTSSTSQTKYNATVDCFKDIAGNYVCSYYAGASPVLDYDAVATSVNNFYNESADAASCHITTPIAE